MDISLEKKLTGFGLIGIIFGGLIPFIGVILTLGGGIAYFIGIYNFSQKLNKDIFKNFIIALILPFVSFILAFVLGAGSIFSIFSSSSHFEGSFILVVFAGIIIWLGSILSAFFAKKYLDIFYEYTNNELFKYAGLGVFYGSFLLILSIIGWLIAIWAFLTMPDSLDTKNSTI
ncbi:MAG: DUF996 domain-containing protein [bacterium]|jgi:uncharacterized membrane protein